LILPLNFRPAANSRVSSAAAALVSHRGRGRAPHPGGAQARGRRMDILSAQDDDVEETGTLCRNLRCYAGSARKDVNAIGERYPSKNVLQVREHQDRVRRR
jgi:hypothetical protein